MLGERRPLIDPSDVRAMSPPCSESKRMRCLIMGELDPDPPPPRMADPVALDLSTFDVYLNKSSNSNTSSNFGYSSTHGSISIAPPPCIRPTPALPPTMPPPLLRPDPLPTPMACSRALAFPGPHAGLLRAYGGVHRWMAMRRGEIPWPPEEREGAGGP